MTPEEFPYIAEIKVNDCYAYKDFVIPIGKGDDGKPFRHLILTGKNGSGKTTILRGINYWMKWIVKGIDPMTVREEKNPGYLELETYDDDRESVDSLTSHWEFINKIIPNFNIGRGAFTTSQFVYSFYVARRRLELKDVATVTKESEIIEKQYKKDFPSELKQFLANKKIYQAFDILDNRKDAASNVDRLFNQLEQSLQIIFEDKGLKVGFVKEEFEFYLTLTDGRKITFNQMADGFSALESIVLELFIRVEITRQLQKNFNLDPSGIVLIDEPESHLHLELQYQVMPLLTTLFPNIQFIVATHSPAVISSISNAVVYDLTKQEAVSDWVVGSSYSELMVKHFGLDNEYSNIADKIIADIQQLVDDKGMKGKEKLAALKQLLDENGKYLAPSTMLEVETNILRIQEAA